MPEDPQIFLSHFQSFHFILTLSCSVLGVGRWGWGGLTYSGAQDFLLATLRNHFWWGLGSRMRCWGKTQVNCVQDKHPTRCSVDPDLFTQFSTSWWLLLSVILPLLARDEVMKVALWAFAAAQCPESLLLEWENTPAELGTKSVPKVPGSSLLLQRGPPFLSKVSLQTSLPVGCSNVSPKLS